jgi:hypothetical protein
MSPDCPAERTFTAVPCVPPCNAVDSVLSRMGGGGGMGRALQKTLLLLVPYVVSHYYGIAARPISRIITDGGEVSMEIKPQIV